MSHPEQPNEGNRGSSPEGTRPEALKNFEHVIESFGKAASAGQTEEARNLSFQALMLAVEEAQKNPTPEMVLAEEIVNCEEQHDWSGAEARRRKVLAGQEATGNFGLICKAHLSLSKFLLLLGRLDEAWASARAATAAARRTELSILVSMALEHEAACALENDDVASALAAASEAVQVVEPGKLHDISRVRALLGRARCLVASGDSSGARRDLAACWEMLGAREGDSLAAGWMNSTARWWEIQSEIETKNGNLHGAVRSIAKAVEKRRAINQLPHVQGLHTKVALARTLDQLGRALTLALDKAAATEAFREAQSIRIKIGLGT